MKAVSSGTAAAATRAENVAAYTETLRLLAKNGIREFAKAHYGDQLTQACLEGSDIVICMNQRVYDECLQFVTLPAGTRIWSVADIGETSRIVNTELKISQYREQVYQEIVEGISQLISEI